MSGILLVVVRGLYLSDELCKDKALQYGFLKGVAFMFLSYYRYLQCI